MITSDGDGGGGGGGGETPLISSVNAFVLVAPVESVNLMVIVAVPAAVGVPEITPAGFNVNPGDYNRVGYLY